MLPYQLAPAADPRAASLFSPDPEIAWLQPYPDRLLDEVARSSMPPTPAWLQGREDVMTAIVQGLDPEFGQWRLLPTWANRQPAAACYLRRPGETEYHAFSVDVLRVEHGKVVEITAFTAELFPAFGLPRTL